MNTLQTNSIQLRIDYQLDAPIIIYS